MHVLKVASNCFQQIMSSPFVDSLRVLRNTRGHTRGIHEATVELDIAKVLFLRFYGPRLRLGPQNRPKKEATIQPS